MFLAQRVAAMDKHSNKKGEFLKNYRVQYQKDMQTFLEERQKELEKKEEARRARARKKGGGGGGGGGGGAGDKVDSFASRRGGEKGNGHELRGEERLLADLEDMDEVCIVEEVHQ